VPRHVCAGENRAAPPTFLSGKDGAIEGVAPIPSQTIYGAAEPRLTTWRVKGLRAAVVSWLDFHPKQIRKIWLCREVH
jgi:hypothetical protein